MNEENSDTILGIIAAFVVVIIIFLFCQWVGYMMEASENEMHEKIKEHINLSKPFNEVISVSSSFICGGEEGWYFVSILATTDEYPDPQWIYDFTYDSNTDTLYYDDNIEGIGVK